MRFVPAEHLTHEVLEFSVILSGWPFQVTAQEEICSAVAQEMKETFSKSSVSCLMRSNLRTLKAFDSRSSDGKDDPCWQVTHQLHFLIEKNVELSDGELVVPQAGLYYIYSQTYFKHTLIEEEEEEQKEEEGAARGKPMLQYVYKKVGSYPVPILLMKNARTTCWSQDAEFGLYSIYQAGLFQLGGGDRLFVTVSNVSTIEMDEKSSFFGAFLEAETEVMRVTADGGLQPQNSCSRCVQQEKL
ncbi:Tumor necrosis factor ligand superfamily member 10 [Bagarius yarrelli]|uniref:Tumor necrosis factor ligand superfamily member 10 n=1 Tax=Bagarius yarrelli TaxID=175774 RepID=A0A556VWG5_BAGYA|nr:Tumor necrosis factor ligand superfamily member 10 [Bagarius yarrelli]